MFIVSLYSCGITNGIRIMCHHWRRKKLSRLVLLSFAHDAHRGQKEANTHIFIPFCSLHLGSKMWKICLNLGTLRCGSKFCRILLIPPFSHLKMIMTTFCQPILWLLWLAGLQLCPEHGCVTTRLQYIHHPKNEPKFKAKKLYLLSPLLLVAKGRAYLALQNSQLGKYAKHMLMPLKRRG